MRFFENLLDKAWRHRFALAVAVLLSVWGALHYAGVVYGTVQVPLHMSYVGDEQAPLNGALHMLEAKSPLGLRNLRTVYYGPIFSVIAVPAVLADIGGKFIFDHVRSPTAYLHVLIYNWGGVDRWLRVTAVLVSMLTLVYVYRILLLDPFNATHSRRYALAGTALVALNFYFFEYSHFYKHWPFLLLALTAQMYYALRIRASGGLYLRDWWLHGVFGVVAFGISYFSVIYYVAFVPLAYALWKQGGDARRTLVRYAGFFLLACAVVVLWHPYALLRYLGFVNVGSMAGKLNNIQNPFVASGASILYYLRLIVLNHLALLGAAGVLVYVFVRAHTASRWWVYMLGSIAFANIALFVPAEHHEGRYMLPTILMLVLGVGIAAVQYATTWSLQSRWVTLLLVTFLGVYLAFHVVHIAQWVRVWSGGPPEQAMVAQALALQEQSGGKPVLLVQNYIAGYPHTRDAYERYVARTGKAEVNLFQEILSTEAPVGVPLLNAQYVPVPAFDADPSVLTQYDHAIRMYEPRPGELNQFDYLDEDMVRLWYAHDLLPQYAVLK